MAFITTPTVAATHARSSSPSPRSRRRVQRLASLSCATILIAGSCTDRAATTGPGAASLTRNEPEEFCSFDVPAARATRPLGINDRGDIIGLYIDQANVTHGFLLEGGCTGTLSTRDAPGASTTFPRGINNRGDITGRYTRPGSAIEHGYSIIDGEFATIDYPDAVSTGLRFINDRGEITGKYVDGAGKQHGFTLIDGAYATLDYPDSRTSDLFGLSNNGVAVGDWTERVAPPVIVHGYRVDDGVISITDVPGATGTLPRWINERGDIAGIFIDASAVRHGYVMDKHGDVTVIDYPGKPLRTEAYGINSRGDVTGSYVLAGVEHGFLLAK